MSSRIRRAFRLLAAPDRIRDDVDAELRFHIDGRIDDLVARGIPRVEAEREVGRMVVLQSVRLAAAGVVIGVAGAVAVARVTTGT